MKYIYSILAITISCTVFSQIIIGNEVGTAANKTSVLLEFAAGQNKGIILPYVRTMPTASAGLAEGTILLDASNPAKAKVKLYKGTADWFDLSVGHEADITSSMTVQPTASIVTEGDTAKTIIGNNSSSANGVLVLESSTKAMVLPMVNSTDDVSDPAPGMLVYINKTGAKRLAVYNGGGWTYWKP